MLCGGIIVLGFWVYCDREELKETRCMNLLAGMLVKAKKFLKEKDAPILMSIFSGQETLPEVWIRNEENLSKVNEQVTMWNGMKRLVKLEARLPVSLVYPLPRNSEKDISFKEITEKMAESLKRHANTLRCTIDDKIVSGEERITCSNVIF